jgi:hypothetical protein
VQTRITETNNGKQNGTQFKQHARNLLCILLVILQPAHSLWLRIQTASKYYDEENAQW